MRSCATLNPEWTAIFVVAVRVIATPLSIKTPHLLEVIKTERAVLSARVLYSACIYARARHMHVYTIGVRFKPRKSAFPLPPPLSPQRRSVGRLVGDLARRLRHTTSNYSFRELPNLVTSRI